MYTGHCWRRTTATLAAAKGMTVPQIKQITGHRSDTVVQNYIDSSIYTKNNASEMLAVIGDEDMNLNVGTEDRKRKKTGFGGILPNNKLPKNNGSSNNQGTIIHKMALLKLFIM